MSKINTHFFNIDRAVELANKNRSENDQLNRRSFMRLLGKPYQASVDWKIKSPEIVSVLVKAKEIVGGNYTIDDLLTLIEDK